jgi:hypothetical protein
MNSAAFTAVFKGSLDMFNNKFRLTILRLFLLPSIFFVELGQASDVNEIMKAVSRICSLPSEQGNDLEFEGTLGAGGIVKLVGVKGEGKLSYKDWEGIQDVLEKDRYNDRKSSRDCVQNILPTILDAYGVNSQTRDELSNLLKRETALQDHYLSDDPVRRSVAFREAFRSISMFHVDLTPTDPTNKQSSKTESVNERNISNLINYYDYETGKFADNNSNKKKKLRGQLHGDSLTFATSRCSGSLHNLYGTWEFKGSVTCSVYSYDGIFTLR